MAVGLTSAAGARRLRRLSNKQLQRSIRTHRICRLARGSRLQYDINTRTIKLPRSQHRAAELGLLVHIDCKAPWRSRYVPPTAATPLLIMITAVRKRRLQTAYKMQERNASPVINFERFRCRCRLEVL